MKKNVRKFFAALMAAVLVIASGGFGVKADPVGCKYTDGKTPSYSYTVTGDVNVITANITFSPADGEAFALKCLISQNYNFFQLVRVVG